MNADNDEHNANFDPTTTMCDAEMTSINAIQAAYTIEYQ